MRRYSRNMTRILDWPRQSTCRGKGALSAQHGAETARVAAGHELHVHCLQPKDCVDRGSCKREKKVVLLAGEVTGWQQQETTAQRRIQDGMHCARWLMKGPLSSQALLVLHPSHQSVSLHQPLCHPSLLFHRPRPFPPCLSTPPVSHSHLGIEFGASALESAVGDAQVSGDSE